MKCKQITVSPVRSEGAGDNRRMAGYIRHRPYANRCRHTAQDPRGGGFRTGRGLLAPAGDTGTPLTPRPRSRLNRPPSARSRTWSCSRTHPAKTLPVETHGSISPPWSRLLKAHTGTLLNILQPNTSGHPLNRDRSEKSRQPQ